MIIQLETKLFQTICQALLFGPIKQSLTIFINPSRQTHFPIYVEQSNPLISKKIPQVMAMRFHSDLLCAALDTTRHRVLHLISFNLLQQSNRFFNDCASVQCTQIVQRAKLLYSVQQASRRSSNVLTCTYALLAQVSPFSVVVLLCWFSSVHYREEKRQRQTTHDRPSLSCPSIRYAGRRRLSRK